MEKRWELKMLLWVEPKEAKGSLALREKREVGKNQTLESLISHVKNVSN